MSGGSTSPSGEELLGGYAVLVGADGGEGRGEHDWLCPATITPRSRRLVEEISLALTAEVERQTHADDLGTVGDLYQQVLDQAEEAGPEGRVVYSQLMAMSLGYWLDCLVVEEVMDRTDATEAQVLDVALLREVARRGMAKEDAEGGHIGGDGA